MIVLVLAIFNPPAIYPILLLSGTVVVCSWFPVCIASVWSKRVTKYGAFAGMLAGFVGCAAMKIVAYAFDIDLPIYLDSFVVGLVLNVLALIIVSKLTKVSPEEEHNRRNLFVVPQEEMKVDDIKKTKRTVLAFIGVGVVVCAMLLVLWVVPYLMAK